MFHKKLWFTLLLLAVLLPTNFMAFGDGIMFKVAVLPFNDSSIKDRWWANEWEVGQGIADMFVTELVNIKKFRVVEREQIAAVLREQKFGLTGLVDQSTAAELGKILGVQYLVVGNVTEFSQDSKQTGYSYKDMGFSLAQSIARVSLDVRMVETSTAEVKWSVTGKGEKTSTKIGLLTKVGALAFGGNDFLKTSLGQALRTAVASAVDQLDEKVSEGGTIKGIIVYVDNSRVIIDAGSNLGVQKGMTFEVQHVVREVRHPKTGELLDEIVDVVAEILVIDVKEKSSSCVIVSQNGNMAIAPSDKIVLKKLSSVEATATDSKSQQKKKKGKKNKKDKSSDSEIVDWK